MELSKRWKIKKEDEAAIDVISYAAHIAAQMGADIIKIKPPSDHISKDDISELYMKNDIKIKTLSDRISHCIKSAFNGKRIVIFPVGQLKAKMKFLMKCKLLQMVADSAQ